MKLIGNGGFSTVPIRWQDNDFVRLSATQKMNLDLLFYPSYSARGFFFSVITFDSGAFSAFIEM